MFKTFSYLREEKPTVKRANTTDKKVLESIRQQNLQRKVIRDFEKFLEEKKIKIGGKKKKTIKKSKK